MTRKSVSEGGARAMLEVYGAKPGALTVGVAERVIAAHLRSLGLTPDRYGNYVVRDGVERWHFSEQNLQHQEKYQGDWRNIDSEPSLDAALALLAEAARVVGDAKAEARVAAARGSRKSARSARAGKAAAGAAEEAARTAAFKRFGFEHPELLLRGLGRGKRLTEAESATSNAALAEYAETYRRALPVGDDGQFASLDRPPFLPLVRNTSYVWREEVGGSAFTVRVAHFEPGVATVEIGDGRGMAVNAATRSWRLSSRDGEGPAYLSGRVSSDARGAISATLFFVVSRRPMGGTQALLLWCRMMRGYGVRRWVGEGLSDDGTKMIDALEYLGHIRITARSGSSAVIECLSPKFNRRPNPRDRRGGARRHGPENRGEHDQLPPREEDVADGVESAEMSYGEDDRGRPCWLNEVRRSPVEMVPVARVRDYDDVVAWLEIEPSAWRGLSNRELLEELTRFRGAEWAERALSWRSPSGWRLPPLVIVRGERFDTLGDGRGRYNLAVGLGLREIPVTFVDVELEPKARGNDRRGR